VCYGKAVCFYYLFLGYPEAGNRYCGLVEYSLHNCFTYFLERLPYEKTGNFKGASERTSKAAMDSERKKEGRKIGLRDTQQRKQVC